MLLKSKQLSVVIADDDRLVLKDLANLVDWKGLGFAVVGMAESGEEALTYIIKKQPELLITDIRMFGMDGLNLIEEAHRRFPGMQFLIISAYNDFNYARRAMASGVSDYLLKTEITAMTLTQKLLAIRDRYEQADENLDVIRMNEMEQYFAAPPDADIASWDRLPEIANEKYYFLVLGPLQQFARDTSQFLEALSGRVRAAAPLFYQIAREHCAKPVYFIYNYYIVIGISDDIGGHSQNSTLKELLSHFRFRQPTDSAVPYVYFYEEKKRTIEEFKPILGRLDPLIIYFMHFQPSRPISFSEMNKLHAIETGRSFPFHTLIFDEEHEEQDIFRIKDYLEECLQNYDAFAIGHFFNKFCALLEISTKETIRLPQRLYTETPEFLMKWCFNYLHQCIVYHSKGMPEAYSSTVEGAIRFIKKNYSDGSLTAVDIADSVGLSANRLGVLFKQETGNTVNEYLNQYRVQRAVELLEKTSMKIYEISEKCGYKSSQYFSQVIFQRTGKRPIDYRKAKR